MMRLASFLFVTLWVASDAFHPSAVNFASRRGQVTGSSLAAASGAPQYEKYDGVLANVEKLAEGSFMLHVEVSKPNTSPKLDYQPGHVLALELEDKSGDLNDDAKNNGGWMRGPYTVSRSTETSLDVLVRAVGKKSKAFSESPVGTPVRFGGKFKVPILEGINQEEAKKVILISTGVGVGPCIGAIEIALQNESFPPVALFASYRDSSDVVNRKYLDELASEHAAKFEWHPIITSESGRLSSSAENLSAVTTSCQGLNLEDEVHFHLIGNGQMVNEWKQGLDKAGIPAERVTIEQYFNHKAEVEDSVIERIASVMASTGVAVEA